MKKEENETVENELTELNDVNQSEELNDAEVVKEEIETNTKKVNFLNPFEVGVTYAEFQKALGKKSVAEYCKGKLSDEQIAFLEAELLILNKK